MQNYNSMNNCCCSCGIKQAICILKDIKDLIKKQTVYFNCGTSYGEIKDSKYPNFVLIEETSETSNKMKINLCIDDINFIKIEPKYGECQSIINELNKYYISPVAVEGKCNENCCCKSSVAAYMKDKYIKPRSDKRKFKITFRNINYSVPNIENHFVTIIHLDYDVAWAIDVIDKSLYLISLYQVCALID